MQTWDLHNLIVLHNSIDCSKMKDNCNGNLDFLLNLLVGNVTEQVCLRSCHVERFLLCLTCL